VRMRKSDAPFAVVSGIALALAAFHAALRSVDLPAAALEARDAPAAMASLSASSLPPPRPRVEDVACKFGPLKPAPPDGSARASPPPPALKAEWLKYVGTIEDIGAVQWLYIKDERAGRLIALRADGKATEEGRVIGASNGELLIEADSIRFSIRWR